MPSTENSFEKFLREKVNLITVEIINVSLISIRNTLPRFCRGYLYICKTLNDESIHFSNAFASRHPTSLSTYPFIPNLAILPRVYITNPVLLYMRTPIFPPIFASAYIFCHPTPFSNFCLSVRLLSENPFTFYCIKIIFYIDLTLSARLPVWPSAISPCVFVFKLKVITYAIF